MSTYSYLKPLESIEYVIEEKDTLGVSGANFLITWGLIKLLNQFFKELWLESLVNKDLHSLLVELLFQNRRLAIRNKLSFF
ncbi:DUF3124 domain-containing protein [Aquimarina sp. BL5]|nr:DUF3124 domain-containing protein [Aquimarina sp. BL5]